MAAAQAAATTTISPPRRKSSSAKRPAAVSAADDSDDSDGASAAKRTKNGDGGAPEHSDGEWSTPSVREHDLAAAFVSAAPIRHAASGAAALVPLPAGTDGLLRAHGLGGISG